MTDANILGPMLEAQFVASLLRVPMLAKAIDADTAWFSDVNAARLLRALQAMTVSVSPVTLMDQLERQGCSVPVDYLSAIMDLDADIRDLSEFQERAARIQETFLRKDAKRRIGATLAQLSDPTTALHDVLAEVNTIVLSVSRDAMGKEQPTAPEIIRKAHTREVGASFASGLQHIDAATTAQGLRKRQVVAIAAKYGSYKTSLILNVCHHLLVQGQSVGYLALEDDQVSYTQVLLAIHSGVPLYTVEDYHERKLTPSNPVQAAALKEAERWLVEDIAERWRVYDAGTYPLYRWQSIASIIAADKVQYSTDVVVLDFLQALSTEYSDLSAIMRTLMRSAQEQDVCVLLLNQMSNETLREGGGKDLFGAKGSGDIGAMIHLGFELQHNHETSRIGMTPDILKEINAAGVQHFLSLSGRKDANGHPIANELAEVVMRTKKVRRGTRMTSCVLIDPLSGKIVLQYGQPRFTKEQ